MCDRLLRGGRGVALFFRNKSESEATLKREYTNRIDQFIPDGSPLYHSAGRKISRSFQEEKK